MKAAANRPKLLPLRLRPPARKRPHREYQKYILCECPLASNGSPAGSVTVTRRPGPGLAAVPLAVNLNESDGPAPAPSSLRLQVSLRVSNVRVSGKFLICQD